MISTLVAALLCTAPPPGADYEAPTEALRGPSSSRLALPVTLRFDESVTDDVTKLVNQGTGKAEPTHSTREPVWAIARYTPSVARRHFEEAKWSDDKKSERSLVVKNVSCTWREGPYYECKVVVDRYEGARRVGQATGSGWGNPDRMAEKRGAAYAGVFGMGIQAELNQPKPQEDGVVIRHAAVAALDQALMQLAAVWAGEQMTAQARRDAEEMMRKAQQGQKKK